MGIVLLGVGALVVGVAVLMKKSPDAPGGSDANKAAGEAAKGAAEAQVAIKTAQALPVNMTTTTPGGTQVTKSAAGTELIEPGFEFTDDRPDAERCSDAAGGPISCDDFSARLRAFNDGNPGPGTGVLY